MRRAFGPIPLLVLIASSSRLLAQSGSWVVTVPSPTVASLGKFGDVPVGLYTGVPDISIPLFTVKGKTLDLPITLSYHPSGLKVDEIGGWVGMGWALSAGGVVTRSVRGLPDEWTYGYYNTGTAFYDIANWPIPNGVLLQNIQLNYIDGEPDQFFVNVAGHSAEFVIGPTSSAAGSQEIRTIPYQDWAIDKSMAGGMISQWVITVEDGTRYTFAAVETSRDLSGWGPLANTPYASSWQLTEIKSPGGDVITLQYQSFLTRHQTGTVGENQMEQTAECPSGTGFSHLNAQEVTAQRLTSITSAAHIVEFTHSLRTDALNYATQAQQEPRLDLISVKAQATGNAVLRKFQFDYDYSIGNPGRLTLKKVWEKDRNNASLPPYEFTYDPTVLPARFSFAQDHWGYYNGATGNGSLLPAGKSSLSGVYYPGADRNSNGTTMKAGVLTRLTYPTGGYNDFIYEANDYGLAFAWGSMFDYGSQQSQAVASNSTLPGVRQQQFTVGGVAAVPVAISAVITGPPPNCQPNCPYARILGAPGGGPWYQSTSVTLGLAPGTYTLEASEAATGTSVSLSSTWRDYIAVGKKTAGGLRVAEIQTADGMGNVSIRKYKYTLQSDPTHSSGMVYAEPKYDYIFAGRILPEMPAPGPYCEFYSRSYMPAVTLGGGSPVVYEEVTVWEGANAEFGKTRHRFQLHDQAPIFPAAWPFHRFTDNFWRWGQETLVEQYDSSNRMQKSVATTYAFPPDSETTRDFHGLSMNTWPNNGGWTWNAFTVQSRWKHPASETTTLYDTTGTLSFATTKTLRYSNPRHAQLTDIFEINSDGKERVTRMRYPGDYPAGTGNPEASALTAMNSSAVHIHNAVIERRVSEKTGATEKVVEAEVTTFREFLTGQFLPYQRFILSSPVPVQ